MGKRRPIECQNTAFNCRKDAIKIGKEEEEISLVKKNPSLK